MIGEKSDEAQKYEILYQKEKEINDFTEKYEKERAQYESQIKDTQNVIKVLLEHM